MSSLVRAVNVFCGLEKYDYLALYTTSLWGFTFDICCFRGATVLALTTLVKALGFAINICGFWCASDFKTL
jgi:hypothetical protein